jgi:hypothetical protein
MSKDFEIMGLFAVPLLKIKFKDHYKYNFPEVKKKDQKPDSWVKSLHTTFPDIPDNDPIVSSFVKDSLRKDLKDSLVNVFKEINLPDTIDFTNLWYNIYHDNQGQEKHSHLAFVGQIAPLWSGVYYNKNASPTRFFRSDRLYRTQILPEAQNTALDVCLAENFSPEVEDGDILIFPPYLEHSVASTPEHKNKMRMTFSFNIVVNS